MFLLTNDRKEQMFILKATHPYFVSVIFSFTGSALLIGFVPFHILFFFVWSNPLIGV